MRRLLTLALPWAAWALLAAPAGAAGPLSILEPATGTLLRGQVRITVSDAPEAAAG